ncbi:MAG: hypothetical protein KIS78_27325 [Labilithrix sp.]|nr:hypothetical protein [Labilithrix sp.]MCW5836143.1 hypothetical protein [Labilithrix sp.]
MMRSRWLLPLLPLAILGACAESEVIAPLPDDASADPPPPLTGADASIDAPADGASESEYRWVRTPIPTSGTALFDVWGSASDDVWAVGARGTVLHWNGKAWQVSPTGVDDTFNAVWGTGASNVWIGASSHLMLRGGGWNADGGGWTLTPPLTAAGKRATIWDINGTGPNDVWAVGDYALVTHPTLGFMTIAAWHWSGDAWKMVPVVNDFSRPGGDVQVALRSVWPASSGDVWLGGVFGRTFRNADWSPLAPVQRAGVVGMAPLPPWKEYDSASRADIERTWGTWANDVWAVGRNGVVRHWDGTSTFLWTTVDVGVHEDLHAVWGRSKDDVWVLGEGSTIVHWDGSRWTREPTEPGLHLYEIWGNEDDVWIVGDDVILRRTKAKENTQ